MPEVAKDVFSKGVDSCSKNFSVFLLCLMKWTRPFSFAITFKSSLAGCLAIRAQLVATVVVRTRVAMCPAYIVTTYVAIIQDTLPGTYPTARFTMWCAQPLCTYAVHLQFWNLLTRSANLIRAVLQGTPEAMCAAAIDTTLVAFAEPQHRSTIWAKIAWESSYLRCRCHGDEDGWCVGLSLVGLSLYY